MADVEALQTVRGVLQAKGLLQAKQTGEDLALVRQIDVQAEAGVVQRKLPPAGALAAHFGGHFNPAAGALPQRRRQYVGVVNGL